MRQSVVRSTRSANRSARSLAANSERRGVTAVEFAIVAPVFLLLIFAGLEFSIVGTIRSTSHNAAYEAARKLVIPGANSADGVKEAERIMGIVGVDTLTVTVIPTSITPETQSVQVNISIPYADNAVFTPWFVGNVTLKSTCTLSTERYDGT